MNMNQNAWAFLASEFHNGKIKAHNLLTPYDGTMKFDEDLIAVLVVRTHAEAKYQERSGGGTELPVRDDLDQPTPEQCHRSFREWEEHSEEVFGFNHYDAGEQDVAEEHYQEWVADVHNAFTCRAKNTDYLEAFLIAYDAGNDVGQFGECDLGGSSWLTIAGDEKVEVLTWNEVVNRAKTMLERGTLRYGKNEHDDRWVVGIDTGDGT